MRRIAVLILAAGDSSRLGEPKQLLRFRGRSLIRTAARAALESDCRPVVAVLGSRAERVQVELNDLPVTTAVNRYWQAGMNSSILAGLQVLAGDVCGAIIMLCDQPFVSAQLLNQLASIHLTTGSGIVASEFGGTLGVPAFFSREHFLELAALSQSEGARSVILKHRGRARRVLFPEGAFDIDTYEDYLAALKFESAQPPPRAFTSCTLATIRRPSNSAAPREVRSRVRSESTTSR